MKQNMTATNRRAMIICHVNPTGTTYEWEGPLDGVVSISNWTESKLTYGIPFKMKQVGADQYSTYYIRTDWRARLARFIQEIKTRWHYGWII